MKTAGLILIASILTAPVAQAQYALQFGAAVAISDNQAIIGQGRNLLQPGTVTVFEETGAGWQLRQHIHGEGNEATGFGRALSADGPVLAIGAPVAGRVHVYSRGPDGQWELRQTITSEASGFGTSLSVDSVHLVVGSNAGATYAYHNIGGEWMAAGELNSPDTWPDADFGHPIAVSGDMAWVGAPASDQGRGAVYTYTWQKSTWARHGVVPIPDGSGDVSLGIAIAVGAGFLAIGGRGRVEAYRRDTSAEWQHAETLMAFDTDSFGRALAISGGMLWVGAQNDHDDQGSVYAFSLNDLSAERKIVVPSALPYRSRFGSALAAAADAVLVGAVGHDNFEGAAFVVLPTDMEISAPIYGDTGEFASVSGGMVQCKDGSSGEFPCANVNMISFLTREEVGARRGIQVNDVWGWEDPETGNEYALVGRTDGTSFIDLSNPDQPRYIGDLPMTSSANPSIWRDIKVYRDHAFIVSDGAGAHHMQIFDLRQLREITFTDSPVEFSATAIYDEIYSAHNIVINEESGFAYTVGNSSGGITCGGALHMIDIRDPVNPTFAGCHNDPRTGRRGSGATHDAQCVTYRGPDARYSGREICLSSNGTALLIVDVTDKSQPLTIAVADYPSVAYTHQGWLTEDQRYFFLNDEGDEASEVVHATRTLILDLQELDDPTLAKEYFGPSNAIDHNLYIHGDIMYQTNYVEGLRVIDISNPVEPVEIGHFDTVPYGPNNNSAVLGAWSNYPYFKSGVIVVTSGRQGVFFLKRKIVDV